MATARNKHKDTTAVNEAEKSENLLQPADLSKDIDELKEQLRQERDLHLRTMADFKNYRRHVEREGSKLTEAGRREIILSVLSIVDDLERALQLASGDEQPLADGVRSIYRKLLSMLERQGVRPFDSVGEPFTPELHEAVAVAEDTNLKPGTVIGELRRGYLWNNDLLRAAQVRVAG